jgi:hypothetical protein
MLAHCDAPAEGTSWQVPSAALFAFMQKPPQHSVSVVQASPVCVQNDGALLQVPFEQ